MTYALFLTPSARKSLKSLPGELAERIDLAITRLADNPRPVGVAKLSGMDNTWRVRVGDYRIVYEIHDREIRILVLKIDHRRDVYR